MLLYLGTSLLNGNIEQVFCQNCSGNFNSLQIFVLLNGLISSVLFTIWMLSEIFSIRKSWEKQLWLIIGLLVPVVGLLLFFFLVYSRKPTNEQFL